MFGRRQKQPQNRPRYSSAERSADRPAAFSYYARRAPERRPIAPAYQRGGLPERGAPVEAKHKLLAHTLKRWPYWLALIIGLICLGKILYVSPSPKVVLIDASTLTSTYTRPLDVYAAAAAEALKASPANHIKLTADTTAIAAKLTQQFPELQSVSVTLPLMGNRPIVYIAPTQPGLILQTGNGNFAVSDSGTVLAAVVTVPDGSLVVRDESGSKLTVGKQVLPGATVTFIETVAYQLQAAQLQLSGFVLPATSAYEVDAHLAGKPYTVRFNLQADPLQQSGAVVAAISHLGSTVPSQYIDARVPERIYYK
jgi:hypothetical protein